MWQRDCRLDVVVCVESELRGRVGWMCSEYDGLTYSQPAGRSSLVHLTYNQTRPPPQPTSLTISSFAQITFSVSARVTRAVIIPRTLRYRLQLLCTMIWH